MHEHCVRRIKRTCFLIRIEKLTNLLDRIGQCSSSFHNPLKVFSHLIIQVQQLVSAAAISTPIFLSNNIEQCQSSQEHHHPLRRKRTRARFSNHATA
mmetsp:Transcript_4442/g.10063  ORF Transcript_4442/g.10063 Transcript_4442/m.10063 type:complete len:97 (-) Transcript_4442:1036-1326(-)